MKVRHSTSSGDDRIELQMTPMIDIVFQLLVFFIMTFKIVSQEGDFNIKMPLASQDAGPPEDIQALPMRVQLRAAPDGTLVVPIRLNENAFDNFAALHNYIISVVGDMDGPARSTAEVELDCDYNLRYEYVIEAITAVSGYIDSSTGRVVKLVEKIKFAPPQAPPE